jgi:very-short-patch-repair endonuclease
MAGFWTALPVGRVTRLTGASQEAIASVFEPMPVDAPAVIICRPRAEVSSTRAVAAVLDRLEAAAIDLYPAWLPGGEVIGAPGGVGLFAVRALAQQAASTTPHLGPFLADLAARSLDSRSGQLDRFPAEVRAAGLARVISGSYQRSRLALLVQPPEVLDPAEEIALVTACEWLARHGGFGVWLTGGGWRALDRVRTFTVHLPSPITDTATGGAAEARTQPITTVVSLPALAGRPHPASKSERALETVLAGLPWATGRVWNRTFRPDPLINPIRVDLMWPDEHCAVEIDGDEHRGIQHYEDDRYRDRLLQQAGFTVLRYTNGEVQRDITVVVSELERFITNRRHGRT